jgi:hypothetical protein
MPEPLASNGAMQQILKYSRGIPIFKEQFFEMLTQIAKFTDEQAFHWMENLEELKSGKGRQHLCSNRTFDLTTFNFHLKRVE